MKLTKEERNVRIKARWRIVQAANRYVAYGQLGAHFTIRHLQQAVFLCRQHKLVAASTLKEAGFNGN